MRRPPPMTALVLALAVVLAACTNDGDDAPGDNKGKSGQDEQTRRLTAAIADRIEQAQTVAFTIKTEMRGQEVTGDGETRYAGEKPSLRVTFGAGGQQAEIRALGQATYAKLPEPMRGSLENGKQWIDLSQEDHMAKTMAGAVQLVQLGDPTTMLARIKNTGTIAPGTTKTELNEQSATRYTIDLRLEGDDAPFGLSKEAVQSLLEAGVTSYEAQLWVNDDNLPMRFIMDVTDLYSTQYGGSPDPSVEPSAPEDKATITITYSEWDKQVDIEAPPETDIGRMPLPTQPTQPGQTGQTNAPGQN